jgi:hypothetical protein
MQDHSRWELIIDVVGSVRGVSPQKEGTVLSLGRTFSLFIRKGIRGFHDLVENLFSLFIFPRRPCPKHSS